MTGKSHRRTTRKAFALMKMLGEMFLTGDDTVELVTQENSDTDKYDDMEWVDVDYGKDNPHRDDGAGTDDDEARYSDFGKRFTGFNHMMDLGKGPGEFDDYDGYSYKRGSASKRQYQRILDTMKGEEDWEWLADLMEAIDATDLIKVDMGIMFYFNDEHVHAPGHPWYQNCSPAIERYSFFGDKGKYSTKEEELADRFPRAECTGEVGKGIPYSVFMPLDNLARYWYGEFLRSGIRKYLGPVLHAIQDASIPHHASGTMGNWHQQWESQLETYVPNWMWCSPDFERNLRSLFAKYYRYDPNPPTSLSISDWKRVPAINWDIEWLVTWMALNAHRVYKTELNNFRDGFKGTSLFCARTGYDCEDMHGPYARKILDHSKELTEMAVALTTLVLLKANQERKAKNAGREITREDYLEFAGKIETIPFEEYIVNKRSKEMHVKTCYWARRMVAKNKMTYVSLDAALSAGYNGCHHCLREHDTG